MVVVDKSGGVVSGGVNLRKKLNSPDFRTEIEEKLAKADYTGVFVETWQNFTIFYQQGYYAIMDEDRTKLYYIARCLTEAVDFLIYSRHIESITTKHGATYEIVDELDHFVIRIYDEEIDGETHIVSTEEEALKFIEQREKAIYGEFEIVSTEEEVNIP
jgi:hypothetical protein